MATFDSPRRWFKWNFHGFLWLTFFEFLSFFNGIFGNFSSELFSLLVVVAADFRVVAVVVDFFIFCCFVVRAKYVFLSSFIIFSVLLCEFLFFYYFCFSFHFIYYFFVLFCYWFFIPFLFASPPFPFFLLLWLKEENFHIHILRKNWIFFPLFSYSLTHLIFFN